MAMGGEQHLPTVETLSQRRRAQMSQHYVILNSLRAPLLLPNPMLIDAQVGMASNAAEKKRCEKPIPC